jgi:hypothetical protein
MAGQWNSQSVHHTAFFSAMLKVVLDFHSHHQVQLACKRVITQTSKYVYNTIFSIRIMPDFTVTELLLSAWNTTGWVTQFHKKENVF